MDPGSGFFQAPGRALDAGLYALGFTGSSQGRQGLDDPLSTAAPDRQLGVAAVFFRALPDGKTKREARSFFQFALHFDGAAPAVHRLVHRKQTQTATNILFGSENRLENPLLSPLVHPRTGIADSELDLRFIGPDPGRIFAALVCGGAIGARTQLR